MEVIAGERIERGALVYMKDGKAYNIESRYCECKPPKASGIINIFGAEICALCKKPIEPLGEKGCGSE